MNGIVMVVIGLWWTRGGVEVGQNPIPVHWNSGSNEWTKSRDSIAGPDQLPRNVKVRMIRKWAFVPLSFK